MTYTITEILNLIDGANAVQLQAVCTTVLEETKWFKVDELTVITDHIAERRKVLEAITHN